DGLDTPVGAHAPDPMPFAFGNVERPIGRRHEATRCRQIGLRRQGAFRFAGATSCESAYRAVWGNATHAMPNQFGDVQAAIGADSKPSGPRRRAWVAGLPSPAKSSG